MALLKLFAFGPPRISLNGERIDIDRRKAIALLFYLALTGHSHNRDTLATLFWPESDQSKARAGLRLSLAALKRGLGDGWLEADRELVRLNPDAQVWADVFEFQESLARTTRHGHAEDQVCSDCLPDLLKAVNAYTDNFMAGFSLRDCPGFDDWQFFQSEGRRNDLARALERLAAGLYVQGEAKAAIEHARRLLALDTLHEAAHRLLMELFARSNQRAAALRQYEDCVEILKDELGACPDEETDRLYELIKEGKEFGAQTWKGWYTPETVDRTAEIQIVNSPPQAISDLFRDRESELAALGDHIRSATARVISVVGRAGMGKTALACRVLSDLEKTGLSAAPPTKGIGYLSSNGLNLDRLVNAIGEMLGEPARSDLAAQWSEPGGDLESKVDDLLGKLNKECRYILLLDNFEDLIDDQGVILESGLRCFVERCLQSQSGIRLILTGRENLHVLPEGQRRAVRLLLDEGLPSEEAIQMLRDLDPDGSLGLKDASQAFLERAARLAGCMPRALELMAFVLRQSEGTLGIDNLLEDEVLFLENSLVVERLAAQVYQRLDNESRQIVEVLAILNRPVPLQAVTFLSSPWYPHLDVEKVLRRLIRAHFASYNRQTRQYSLHPVDRAYALRSMREQAESPGAKPAYTRSSLEQRAALWYQGVRKPENDWKSIDDLEPQLYEFEHLLRAGYADQACALLDQIDRDYLRRWGHSRLLVNLRERLLARLEGPRERESNHRNLGHALKELGRFTQAIEQHQAALSIAQEAGDKANEGAAYGNLGTLHNYLGQVDQAIRYHEAALQIARQVGDQRRAGLWYANLGVAYLDLGQYVRAIDHSRAALNIFLEIGDKANELRARGSLGVQYAITGRTEESIQQFEHVLDLSRLSGNRTIEMKTLTNLGVAVETIGQIGQSFRYHQIALEISREIGDHKSEGTVLGNLGDCYYKVDQIKSAITHFNEALKIAQEIGHKEDECFWLLGLCDSYLSLGRLQEAEYYSHAGLKLAAESGYTRVHCQLLVQQGWILLALNQASQAKIAFSEASDMNVPDTNFLALNGLGVACLRTEDKESAERAFNQAIAQCETLLGGTLNLYAAWYSLGLARAGLALMGIGSMDASIADYKKALELCDAAGIVKEALRKLEEIEIAGLGDLNPVKQLLNG